LNPLSVEETEIALGKVGKLKGFPTSMVPSDHLPVGACFKLLMKDPSSTDPTSPFHKVWNSRQKASTSSEEEGECGGGGCETNTMLSEPRKLELREEWQQLKQETPPKVKGKPTSEQICERQLFKAKFKTWQLGLSGAEQEYVKQL
jgi:hypothetical protein